MIKVRTKLTHRTLLALIPLYIGLILYPFQISTLVLNSQVIFSILIPTLLFLVVAWTQKTKMQILIKNYLLQPDPHSGMAMALLLGPILIFISLCIAISFRFGVQTALIEAQILDVRPARIGGTILQLEVEIPEHELTKKGTSYFRYNPEGRDEVFLSMGKLKLHLQKGFLGLTRAIPTAEQSYLINNFIGR